MLELGSGEGVDVFDGGGGIGVPWGDRDDRGLDVDVKAGEGSGTGGD